MKNLPFLILIVLLIISSCAQQDQQQYNKLISEAQTLYETGEYEGSGKKYAEAFAATKNIDSTAHRYQAAEAWAKANNKDAAFDQLLVISNEGQYSNLLQISSDLDLNSLNSDKRWMSILKKVRENQEASKAGLAEVSVLLEEVLYDDQKYRQETGEIQEKFGHDSEEVRAHWELIGRQDSLNLLKVEQVLDEHGWLGWDVIGRSANSALFLVIQHADLETQEKYLPVLRDAVKKGNAAPADLALLEDRVALRQGKKQIYGSQIGRDPETGEYYVSPLEDPDNVDQRRAEVGLEPLQNYISNWDLTWDVQDYKMIQNSKFKIQD